MVSWCVFAAGTATPDMRKNYHGLSALAKHVLNENPLSGALFVFINRRRTPLKCLCFDCNGYCIWAKRLERGLFQVSRGDDAKCSLDARTLQHFIDGIDLYSVRQLTGFRREISTISHHESGHIISKNT
ncbi:MAG: transposase [Gammaproteobacteria bacterium]|jgi:transposase